MWLARWFLPVLGLLGCGARQASSSVATSVDASVVALPSSAPIAEVPEHQEALPPIREQVEEVLGRAVRSPSTVSLISESDAGRLCRSFSFHGTYLTALDEQASEVRMSLRYLIDESGSLVDLGWVMHPREADPSATSTLSAPVASCGSLTLAPRRLDSGELEFERLAMYDSDQACQSALASGAEASLDASCWSAPEAYLRAPGTHAAAFERVLLSGGRAYELDTHRGRADLAPTCNEWRFEARERKMTLREREGTQTVVTTYRYEWAGDFLTLFGPHVERSEEGAPSRTMFISEASPHFVRQLDDDTVRISDQQWHLTREGCEAARHARAHDASVPPR